MKGLLSYMYARSEGKIETLKIDKKEIQLALSTPSLIYILTERLEILPILVHLIDFRLAPALAYFYSCWRSDDANTRLGVSPIRYGRSYTLA
jgi:hypothetical protein